MTSEPNRPTVEPVDSMVPATELIETHEARLSPRQRRETGAHYTPSGLARFLVRLSLETHRRRTGRLPRTICDPTCGGGSFLVAAAEELRRHGVDPAEIVNERIVGHEIDPAAADVARRSLLAWAHQHGERDDTRLRPRVDVADGLDPTTWTGGPGHDLVVGNPPYLTQLRSATALDRARLARLAAELGPLDPYVDASALFLLLATRATATGGVTCLVMPQSFLSVRGSQNVRDRLLATCELSTLWASDAAFFDAAVQVCALVLSPQRSDPRVSLPPDPGDGHPARPSPTAGPERAVTVLWGGTRESLDVVASHTGSPPGVGDSWGPLLAAPLGIPPVALAPGRRLGEVASATAGFRDEYYALRDACTEAPVGADFHGSTGDRPVPLVTVGMIRPGGSDWGQRPARIGGQRWQRPVVDLAALEASDPRVARWARARLMPKVLVATQTRVVEAVADSAGTWVPLTPVISVEPRVDWKQLLAHPTEERPDLWWLVAALSAPAISALALARNLGAGLSTQALRWSAKAVEQVALPPAGPDWQAGARAARALADCRPGERRAHLQRLGRHLNAAHGLAERDDLFEWWLERALRA